MHVLVSHMILSIYNVVFVTKSPSHITHSHVWWIINVIEISMVVIMDLNNIYGDV